MKKHIENRLKHLSKLEDMLNWGYLKETERIREIRYEQEVEDKKIRELGETHRQGVKDIKEEISKLVDEYYKK